MGLLACSRCKSTTTYLTLSVSSATTYTTTTQITMAAAKFLPLHPSLFPSCRSVTNSALGTPPVESVVNSYLSVPGVDHPARLPPSLSLKPKGDIICSTADSHKDSHLTGFLRHECPTAHRITPSRSLCSSPLRASSSTARQRAPRQPHRCPGP